MNAFWFVLALPLILLVWFLSAYNGLVRLRNQVRNAWAQIEVQLKKAPRPDPQPCRDGQGLRGA